MLRRTILAITLLSCLTYTVPLYSQNDTLLPGSTFLSFKAQLLRIDNGRLFVWVEASYFINTDFRLSIAQGDQVIGDFKIAKTMDQVAATESLAVSLVEKIRFAKSLALTAYLDTAHIADRLMRVGMPAILQDDYSFTLPTDSAISLLTLPECNYYHKLSEAEIDLAIGKIDMLIVPSTEVPDNSICTYDVVPTGNFVEWFIISNLSDDDLYTCALSYCLKKQFAAEQLPTLLLDTNLVANGFPRNKEKARALFDRVRSSLPSRRCHFESTQLPGMIGKLERELSTSGGRLSFDNGYGGVDIRLLHIAEPSSGSLDEMCQDARKVFYSGCIQRGWVTAEHLPDSCRGSDTISIACEHELSNWLSRECRFIPLGRLELVALVRKDVHCVANRYGRFSITNFYRSK